MTVKNIQIRQFRNLIQINSELSPTFNVYFGNNGSGKTSFLEALYVLGHGKSFRTRSLKPLVQKSQEKFTLHAKVGGQQSLTTSIGIENDLRNGTTIHIDGNHCNAAAPLVQHLPMLMISSDSYQLIEAGPQYRRKFLNWGLFHVEQSFFPCWLKLQRVLKQRNNALRRGLPRNELRIWHDELVHRGEEIDKLRQEYFQSLESIVMELLAELAIFAHFRVKYHRGWPDNVAYGDILQTSLQQDLELGYTRYGPHRADLKLVINETPAEVLLSRGQQKILVNVLLLAQGLLLQRKTDKKCVYLVDDLPSELDVQHQRYLVSQLTRLNAQVFVTGVAQEDLLEHFQSVPHQMFHVEHGRITAI